MSPDVSLGRTVPKRTRLLTPRRESPWKELQMDCGRNRRCNDMNIIEDATSTYRSCLTAGARLCQRPIPLLSRSEHTYISGQLPISCAYSSLYMIRDTVVDLNTAFSANILSVWSSTVPYKVNVGHPSTLSTQTQNPLWKLGRAQIIVSQPQLQSQADTTRTSGGSCSTSR